MALITDPDQLEDSAADDGSQEVYINTSTKTIKLVTVGNLSTDGVTLKCLYSFLKEEWRTDPNTKNLAAFPFPMTPITDEQFELVDGWDFVADASRYLIRTGGWAVRNVAGNVTQMWAGVVGLGDIEAGDQLYFQQSASGAATNFQLTGQVNQAVQILRDDDGDGVFAEGSDFDRRSYLKIFVREQAQVYDDSDNTSIGRPALTFQSYGFPISTAVDLNIVESDVNIAANAPYTSIVIRYFDQAFTRDVDSGTGRSFGIVVDVGTHSGVDGSAPGGASVLTTAEGGMTINAYAGGTLRMHEGTDENTTFPIVSNTATTITVTGTLAVGSNMSFTTQRATPVVATLQEIYEKIQYQLRQNSDIDATDQSVTGKTADLLAEFVGSTLKLGTFAPTNPNGGGSGVIIEGFRISDTNDLVFTDNGAAERSYPFVASLTINFGANLVADASAKYWVYFTSLPGGGNDFGESGAVIVDDNDGVDMAGDVSAASSVTLSFNYDGNSQGGRTPGTDATITVVALGLATGQYVRATGTIGRSTSNSVSLTASLERNYSNP